MLCLWASHSSCLGLNAGREGTRWANSGLTPAVLCGLPAGAIVGWDKSAQATQPYVHLIDSPIVTGNPPIKMIHDI